MGEAIGLFANETQMASWASKNLGVDWKKLDEAGKQVARLEFATAMQKAAGATGQAARESSGYENQVGNLKQAWQDFKALIGTPFLDVVVTGLQKVTTWLQSAGEKLQQFSQFVKDNQTLMELLGIGIGTITALIIAYNIQQALATAGTTLWGAIAGIATGATTALGTAFAFLTSPIGLIILAIGAVIAIGVLLYKNWDTIKAKSIEIWNAIKDFFSSTWQSIKVVATTVWNSIKEFFSTVWNGIKAVAVSIWNGIKAYFSTVLNIYKTIFTTAWNGIKSFLTGVWNGIKYVALSVWNGIKSTISSVVNGIKTAVVNTFNGVKSTATSIWNSIKSAITNPIETARDTVKKVIDKIKSFFNFSWSLPKLKMPHFSIKGSFSINPPKVPSFGVSWYKDGAIFDRPTLFNTPYGMKGVGEAGPEAVLPIKKLPELLGLDENTEYKTIIELLKELIAIVKENGQSIIIENMNVRDESDIKKIARELYLLSRGKNRGLGMA
ncbi:hypothetical protein [Tepidibacillus marianensis]|uniref:phage tail protein n=1 Tax=Tepidibacillus marianensis TaxID=3131995 RepID=UPI0030D38C03